MQAQRLEAEFAVCHGSCSAQVIRIAAGDPACFTGRPLR
jgi:hypothetical protein